MQLPAFVFDPLIRRKARLHAIDVDRFEIRLARTAQEYEDAFRLVHVGYVFQGIEPLKTVDLRMTEQHVLPEASVLVAYEGRQIVGTISVTKDSPAGLPLDKDYPEELEALRRIGARISEIGSLAVVRRCWHTSLMPLLGMAAARLGFRVNDSTHEVIGIHPKAAPFYRALFNFQALGAEQSHAELTAPVIGMVHERDATRAHMIRRYRRRMENANGILPGEYSFGPATPRGLYLPEDIPADEWPRFKMSRDVFRQIFVERSNRVVELSHRTSNHLRSQRTEETIGITSTNVHGSYLSKLS
jgi:hypothetical protein